MEYKYDAVGSALQMVQNTWDLDSEIPITVTNLWSYDDRYRFTNETVCTAGVSPATNSTAYSWDDADNRLSKIAYSNDVPVSSTTYTNNALNQMTDWYDSVANKHVAYEYDDNGARTNKSVTIGGSPASVTAYAYDEDNRLVDVLIGPDA